MKANNEIRQTISRIMGETVLLIELMDTPETETEDLRKLFILGQILDELMDNYPVEELERAA